MSTPLSVTIVIPVYNEALIIADSLTKLLTFLSKELLTYGYRILVVDNASTDQTADLVSAIARHHPEVSLLRLTEKGKGRAVRAGWDTGGDILVFMDADLSSDLSFFPALITPIASGTADLAIGNRLGRTSVLISEKRGRKIASQFYNALARLLLRTGIDDHQCGFKAISKNAYARIRPHGIDPGFFFDTELIAWTKKLGFAIAQIDIRWVDSPVSKVSLFSDSIRMFGSMLELAARLHL